MHIVVISKPPEFEENGEPVSGQCEPYLGGWRLRLIQDGGEEELLSGTYHELRCFQLRCIGKGPEEIRAIAAEVAQNLKKSEVERPHRDDEDEDTKILDAKDVRRALAELDDVPTDADAEPSGQ